MDIIYRYDLYNPIQLRELATPDDAIQVLRDGHGRFVQTVTQLHGELVGSLPTGQIVIPANPYSLGFSQSSGAESIQAPFAVVLGCSDARVPIERIFDLPPNELFVVRVAGNVLGIECLGSISYAVHNLQKSLRLVIVMGHTNCGAVAAAVDSYIDPVDYSEIALGFPLRSVVDRLHIAVRAASGELERLCGSSIISHPGYRRALLEVAVYLNAALTAYDIQRELRLAPDSGLRVVYGVFDLIAQRVGALPCPKDLPEPGSLPTFGKVPDSSEGFAELGAEFARNVFAKGYLGPVTV